jgi:hypothetical protein
MTLVRCGTCGRPGLMCECGVATARHIHPISREQFGRWNEPVTGPRKSLTLDELRRELDTRGLRPFWHPPLAGMGDEG